MICVFDCESIPDVELLRKIYDYGGNDIEVCEMAFKAQENLSGSSFLPLPFHKIISISAVICDDNCNFIKVGNYKEGLSEQEIISDFLLYFNKHNPKLVSFNGKTFDIPDFRNEEERARWENDELSPFPDENGKVSLPCASEPYEPSAQDIEAAERDWKQG